MILIDTVWFCYAFILSVSNVWDLNCICVYNANSKKSLHISKFETGNMQQLNEHINLKL